jgi:hypothetical protein
VEYLRQFNLLGQIISPDVFSRYTTWPKVCGHLLGKTFYYKIIGTNMELVPPLLPQQPPLFWEGFPLDVGKLLRGPASIQPKEH